MTEVVEASDFVTRTVLPMVQIIAELIRSLEIDQVHSVLFANRVDYTENVFLFLRLPSLIPGTIYQPGNLSGWSILISKLVDSKTTRSDEIEPPVIMRLDFVFFPGHEGDSASPHNVLTGILT